MAAAASLQAAAAALTARPVRAEIVASFGAPPGGSLDSAQAESAAARVLASLRSSLAQEHGLSIARLRGGEISAIRKDASTATPGAFSEPEYKELVGSLVKYAALKAHHNPGRRWTLGMAVSAAGAVALTFATFTSAGVLLAAAPAGAAVGAVAAAVGGRKQAKRDRRAAASSAASAEPEAAPAPAPAVPELQPVAPRAAEAACERSGGSTPRGSSEELVSAVVEVATPTPEAPKAAAEAPARELAVAASPEPAVAPEALQPPVPEPLLSGSATPELAKSATPEPPAAAELGAYADVPLAPHPSAAGPALDAAAAPALAPTPALPPLALKKQPSGSLKQSFKSLKRALSSSGSRSARTSEASDAGSDAPSSAKRSGGFFSSAASRRLSSASSTDLGEVPDATPGARVELSEGSATMRKFKDVLRRSLTLGTPRGADAAAKAGKAF